MNSQKNRTRYKFSLAALIILSVLPGCSNNNPVLLNATNPVKLQFSAAQSRSASRTLTANDANEIIFIDLSETEDGTHKLYHSPLYKGDNTVTLQKGDLFAIGLAHNPESAESSSIDYISSVGSFFIADGDLNSLPFSIDSKDFLDLGNMVFDGDSYSSAADVDSIQTATGYSSAALASYGAADTVFRNIVNPDIDRDGKYDSDHDNYWRFCTLVDINMADTNIDFNSPSGPADSSLARFNSSDLRYCLWIKNFDIGINAFTNWDDICIELKNYDDDGNLIVTYCFDDSPAEGAWRQFFFRIEDEKFTPGDFTLSINGKPPVLYFNDIRFITPENNYEGFIFPLVECTADAGGTWQTLKWRWLQIRNGEYTPVIDPDTIKLMINDMYFYFWEDGNSEAYSPEHFGDAYHYYEDGSIDISSYNFTMGPSNDVNYGLIRADYWDIGENDYSFGYSIID